MRWMTMLLSVLVVSAVFAKEDVNATRDFDELWKKRMDIPAREAAFRKLLDAARANENADVEYVAELLTQIARTHSMRRTFDKAHELLDEAVKVYGDREGVAKARILLERGRCHNSNGEREKASELFKEALDHAKKLGADYYTIDAMHMLGISEPPEKALDWNLEAIKVAERSKVERARGWRGALYNNTGWSYFEKQKYEVALTYFRSNVAFREETGTDNGIARWSEAKALRMLKRYKEAMKIQRALEARYEREKKSDAFVLEEIAELLWAQGEKEEAKPYFVKAYEALQKIPWMKADKERMDAIRERAGIPAPEGEDKDDAPADEEEVDGGE